MNTRIYTVQNGSDEPRLVEATSQSQALHFVARAAYTVEIAKPKTVAALMSKGVAIEDATKGAPA